MGNRAGLSFYDAKTANLAYKCSGNIFVSIRSPISFKIKTNQNKLEKCMNPPICHNDGFLTAECSCQCPMSTSGLYCEGFIATGKKNHYYLDLSKSF